MQGGVLVVVVAREEEEELRAGFRWGRMVGQRLVRVRLSVTVMGMLLLGDGWWTRSMSRLMACVIRGGGEGGVTFFRGVKMYNA